MRHKIAFSALLITAGVVFGPATALAYDEARAKMLSYTCAGCHGTDGVSVGPASPTLAGMAEDTFTDAMETFKSGERPSTIMERIAKGYSEEDVALMAKFFAAQTYQKAQGQEFDPKKAKRGKKLHKKHCEKCHEEGGTMDVDGSGILAGRWKTYLEYSLEDYNDGSREATKKMAKKLEKVRKTEGQPGFDALIHYYISQQ